MLDTVTRYLSNVGSLIDKSALRLVLTPIGDRLSSQATSSAGLVVGATNTTSQTGTVPFAGVASGVPVAIAASTLMPALTGLNITAGSYNVFCYFVDAASVVTVLMGTEGTTLAKVGFPQFPQGKALVGYLVVTFASQFVGGTTPLSTATTVYVSPVGSFDPTVLI